MRNNPIGIFDSGIGGLSVFKEVKKLLPHENIIYLADSKNCPYGTKTQQEVIDLCVNITNYLLSEKCKIIIVACNTATAAAIDVLRKKYSIPFIGMEPAIKPAAKGTNTGKIGILATEGTFKGRLFKQTSKKFANNIDKIVQIGEGLVELAEIGKADTDEAIPVLKRNTDKMVKAGVDKIVLGCTHYPFFIPRLKAILPPNIEIIDPSPAIAKRTFEILNSKGLLSQSDSTQYQFYNTGELTHMQTILHELPVQEKVNHISLS